MAKVGLVEPAPDPVRTAVPNRGRAAAVGFSYAGDGGPAGKVAGTVMAAASDAHDSALYQRFSARRDLLPAEWADATGSHQCSLNLTPAELVGLLEAVDALIRPYVRPIRQGAPEGSAIVHMSPRAFLNPDVYGNSGRQK